MDNKCSLEEIEVIDCDDNNEKKNSIKSKAIVKYSAVQIPVKFARLQCNTDLNSPPSNWLINSANTYGLQHSLSNSSGFSSFSMANLFPDCLGEVDVVSDAENIKRLLKLPYSPKNGISMIIHRIENTLLIDEFDIHKYLLKNEDNDWKWLRKFIYNNILNSLNEKDMNFFFKKRSREVLQQKHLISKFLYHSLSITDESDVNSEHIDQQSATSSANNDINIDFEKINITDNTPSSLATNLHEYLLTGPLLPEPNSEENIPDPKSKHDFNRNVVWTFEDIRMLIGTDMPIFGDGTRPCISLRLRDMTKPINVLTGIDYWLDNLMCNVPEVVMCYHLDGIVQKYELIKTEDLPYLNNSKFSPKLIRNVAQNILSFLKTNATKSGHTYWLFKGRNDDVVKLYDLTTLCTNNQENNDVDDSLNPKHTAHTSANSCSKDNSETSTDPTNEDDVDKQNPFTVPVAMLLYTVARNMKNNTFDNITPKRAGSIKTLLDNCIKLLPKKKYPQIVTSSHYILSDLYIPSNINPVKPIFNNNIDDKKPDVYDDDDENDNEDDFVENDDIEQPAIKRIDETLQDIKIKRKLHNKQPPPLVGNVNERCKLALKHILNGLMCLKYFNNNNNTTNAKSCNDNKDISVEKDNKEKILYESENLNIIKNKTTIPLPYEKLVPEAKMINPDLVIPLTWDSNQKKLYQEQQQQQKLSKTKNKRNYNNKKKHEEIKSNLDEDLDSPRSLLLKGTSGIIKSWDIHLKVLLYEKACLTYATMSEYEYSNENYGTSLKYIYKSIKCEKILNIYIKSLITQKSCLLGRAGDCFFQLSKNWTKINYFTKQFLNDNEMDKKFNQEINKDIDINYDNINLPRPNENMENLMQTSCKFYELALELATINSKNELMRRLGSVRNELGVKYMLWAQEEYDKSIPNDDTDLTDLQKVDDKTCCDNSKNDEIKENLDKEPLYQILAHKSYDCLTKGIEIFEKCSDTINLSLLLCNMGRFMRFRAHIKLVYDKTDKQRLNEKYFYNQSFIYYQRALNILGSRKKNPDLWDLVNWDLSTATFTLAKQLQDFSYINDSSKEEVSQDVVDTLKKSLKYCDVNTKSARQILYIYRSGLIHRRLGAYYHYNLRDNDDGKKKLTLLQLSRLHYDKSIKIFFNLNEIKEYLEVQMERIALYEYLAEDSTTASSKLRYYINAYELFQETKDILNNLDNEKINKMNINDKENYDNIEKLLLFFEKRLQIILRLFIQIHMTKNIQTTSTSSSSPVPATINTTITSANEKNINLYKKMYSLTLRSSVIKLDLIELAKHLFVVLNKIHFLYNEKS